MKTASTFAAVLFACACATGPAGTYEAVLPVASGGGERHVRVTLKSDGGAAVSSAFSGRPSRFLAEGAWTQEERRITVKEWDHAVWGEAGPGVLWRVR